MSEGPRLPTIIKPTRSRLSPLEFSLLKMYAQGLSVTAIARQRGRSRHTIKAELAEIRVKLNADTTASAMILGCPNKNCPMRTPEEYFG